MVLYFDGLAVLTTAALLLLPTHAAVYCDENSYPAGSTKASKLVPNTFHKLCPSTSSLGEPSCGDGTPFAFYYSSPVRRRSSNKILLEFLGGGACWNADTCGNQADMLTFPYIFDDLTGLSCSEIQAGLDENGGMYQGDGDLPLNMLCAQTMGGEYGDDPVVDFREYHTIIVPYCTQDTHMGSKTVDYGNNDDDGGQIVHHKGAHNTMAVLEWIYDNFPHPEHIAITGCSAGATVLPLVYDLLFHHYNRFKTGGKRTTSLSTVLDSPVFLTPENFLQYGLPNWNVEPMMKKVRFNFDKYSHSEEFSTKLMEHVLKRGYRKNQWGVISHTQDPVSYEYFTEMSGYNNRRRRRLDDGNNYYYGNQDDWWTELSTSINSIVKKHRNVDSFYMEAEAHCSFGLYYGITTGGENFRKWASNILKSRKSLSPSASGWFWASLLVAVSLIGATGYHQRRRAALGTTEGEYSDGNQDSDGMIMHSNIRARKTLRTKLKENLQKLAATIAFFLDKAPVTIAYGAAVTITFVGSMTWNGIEDIVYNPSIGPSATTLSAFGINNPTLVVYRHQILRVLITSTFLCSGVITYLMVMYSLVSCMRRMEKAMSALPTSTASTNRRFQFASSSFFQLAVLISIGCNILYACTVSGASCSSMALILGLQTFSTVMHRYHQQKAFPSLRGITGVFFVFTSLFLPFNSWVMMLYAIILGGGLAAGVYWVYSPPGTTPGMAGTVDQTHESYTTYSEDNNSLDMPNKVTLLRKQRPFKAYLFLLVVLFTCLVMRIRKPKRMFEQPFLTGCELVYTTHVDEIMNSEVAGQFAGQYNGQAAQNGDQERQLGDDDDAAGYDEEYMCAQFCVPHLVSRPLIWGANIYTGFDVTRGWCEEVGYSQHIADKTFSYKKIKKYSVEVELYFDDNYALYDDDDH
ncbi:Pectinacetylesterase [Seminavis robusta]|uniref:Pectinacetylesterase n=1 Tax=Seminavis robusta TaxID=568900 RepID=A0A9N8E4E3_9STRA|nr:Pectinacetylesterase [Seminavis robusta]|eukprot:Sro538_g162700.1 Pectinacetylesterase (915) ;mRNA; r:54925-57772